MKSICIFLLASAAGLQPIDESSFRGMVREHRGKVLLVNFWATWCDPCREELPALASLDSRLRARGFVLATVSADEPEQEGAATELLRKDRVRGPAYIKRALSNDRFINMVDPRWSGALPALFLFDRSGRQVRSFIGESDPKAVEAAVRQLL